MQSPARERIVEATLQALAEGGPESLKMTDVAGRASTSIGTIYRLFGDKDALVLDAHDAFLARIESDSWEIAQSAGVAPRDLVHGLVTQLLGLLSRNARLIHAFSVIGLSNATIQERGSAQIRRLARRFEAEVLRVREQCTHPSPEIAVDVCFRLVFDVASRTATHGPGFGTGRTLDWPELGPELADACGAYLLGPPAPVGAVSAPPSGP